MTTSPSSNFVPNILSKSQNNATLSKLGSTSILSTPTQKQAVVLTASTSPCSTATAIAVTTVVSSTPSVVMSTATCECSLQWKQTAARLQLITTFHLSNISDLIKTRKSTAEINKIPCQPGEAWVFTSVCKMIIKGFSQTLL